MTSISQALAGKEKRADRATGRFWEVDSLRGVAIIMMVIFHMMWDLRAFAEYYIVLHEGFWFYFQRTTATLFISLAGVSLVLSYNRAKARAKDGHDQGLFRKFFLRGLRIFAVGMAITVVVSVSRIGRIDFGVLHLIGFSIMVAYPFLRYRLLNLALGAGLVVLGQYFQTLQVESLWLVWLGIEPENYYFLDYFPVVPWFGVLLIGIFVGNTLYGDYRRRFFLPDWSGFFPLTLLQFLGRHSLLIYVIHQPILVTGLVLTGMASIF
jgi:uncharacterized membrane protein